MLSFIFSILAIAIVVGIVIGFIKGPFSPLFAYYGGFLGTLLAFVINTFEWCFICFVVGCIIPFVDLGLGLILGPLYCLYCWVFDKENKLLNFVLGIK